MDLWILGELYNKANAEEASQWELFGIFLNKEEAISAYNRIITKHPEQFFILPVKVGELLFEDITSMSSFEFVIDSTDKSIC